MGGPRLAGMRPLSLIRPPAWPLVAGPAAADSGSRELAAVVPHRVSVAAAFLPGGLRARELVTVGMGEGLGGGERVVAELGQDVAGLPDDLAGLRQGGALTVLAVPDSGVVGVVGGRSAGVGLAGLIDRPAQHRRSLPGQAPGRAFAVRRPDGDVQPGEPDRSE